MKKTIILLIMIISVMTLHAQSSGDTIIANNPKNLKIKVYYFHITNRCSSCKAIEANVRKTLNDNFLNQMETGVIDLYILNCELPENKEIAKKYDAYGATLAYTTFSKGKEVKSEDLTSWAFKKAHDPLIFVLELKTQIEELIK
jgi:C4-dicarboxylate transporter